MIAGAVLWGSECFDNLNNHRELTWFTFWSFNTWGATLGRGRNMDIGRHKACDSFLHGSWWDKRLCIRNVQQRWQSDWMVECKYWYGFSSRPRLVLVVCMPNFCKVSQFVYQNKLTTLKLIFITAVVKNTHGWHQDTSGYDSLSQKKKKKKIPYQFYNLLLKHPGP